MAKITHDTTGIDPNKPTGFEPYEGPVPKPGVYWAEIQVCKTAVGKDSGNTYFKVLYRLGPNADPAKNECKGAPIWDNVVPGEHELSQARLAQLINSICGKPKAVFDVDDDTNEVKTVGGKKPVGTKVRLVVAREMYQGEPQARVSDVFPVPKGDTWGGGAVAAAEPEEEVEEEETEEAEEEIELSEEEEARSAELSKKTLPALKKIAKDAGIEEVFKTKEEAVAAILDAEFGEGEEEEEEEEEEVEEEAEEEEEDESEARRAELAGLDRAGLKAALKEADPDFKVLKRHSDADLLEAIIAAEFEPAEDDSEPPF